RSSSRMACLRRGCSTSTPRKPWARVRRKRQVAPRLDHQRDPHCNQVVVRGVDELVGVDLYLEVLSYRLAQEGEHSFARRPVRIVFQLEAERSLRGDREVEELGVSQAEYHVGADRIRAPSIRISAAVHVSDFADAKEINVAFRRYQPGLGEALPQSPLRRGEVGVIGALLGVAQSPNVTISWCVGICEIVSLRAEALLQRPRGVLEQVFDVSSFLFARHRKPPMSLIADALTFSTGQDHTRSARCLFAERDFRPAWSLPARGHGHPP